MAMRGERFELNLDPEDAYLGTQPAHDDTTQEPKLSSAFDFVKDVLERKPAAATPPEPPKPKSTASGFPAHKKRGGPSRFKQLRAEKDSTGSENGTRPPASGSGASRYLSSIANVSAEERQSIDQQNAQLIANMSPQELAEARQELLSESSVSLVQRILQRSRASEAKITDGNGTVGSATEMISGQKSKVDQEESSSLKSDISLSKKNVTFADAPGDVEPSVPSVSRFDEDAAPPVLPSDLQSLSSPVAAIPVNDVSLPVRAQSGNSKASQTPSSLDPSSVSFLSDLHSTYFPDLPADPNQLAWMAPLSEDQTTTASGTQAKPQDKTPPSHLRFGFRGNIITKSASAAIPVTKGLHHHGNDPGDAGYTINELSIYSRSTVPAQRCFAYQLLGRVLYRLGKGDFGSETSEQVKGLYDEMKRGYVLDQLLQEAAREPGSGNESARIWALEAVWLWRKGGGKGLDNLGIADDEVMGEAAGRILAEGLN